MILRLEPFSGKIAGSSDGFLDDTFILTTSRNPVNNDIAESLGKLGKLGICLVRGFLEVGNLTGNRLSTCLLYTSPSPRDGLLSRMPSSA